MKEEAWDREIERDFAPGGRGEAILAEVQRKIAQGQFEALPDGFLRRKQARRRA